MSEWQTTQKSSYLADFIELNKDMQQAIVKAVKELEQDPSTPRGDTIKKLKGYETTYTKALINASQSLLRQLLRDQLKLTGKKELPKEIRIATFHQTAQWIARRSGEPFAMITHKLYIYSSTLQVSLP
jgi:hypothetical protein